MLPVMVGGGPSWAAQAPRWVSRGCSRFAGAGFGGAVAAGVGDGERVGLGVGGRIGECELPPVPGRAADGGCSWWWRGAEHAVGAESPQQLHGQISQQVRQAGHVIAGVEHDEDVGISGLVPPGLLEPPDHLAQLGGGHRGRIVTGTQAHRIQQRGPRCAARLQRRHKGIGPTGDHLCLTLAPPVNVTKRPIGAGRRVRAQPRTHVHGQRDPPLLIARHRQGSQRPAQQASWISGHRISNITPTGYSPGSSGRACATTRR